jgi:sulfotransferase
MPITIGTGIAIGGGISVVEEPPPPPVIGQALGGGFYAGQIVTTRCDALMDVKKEGQVVKPYYFLEEGLLLNPDMIMLVEYESLCKQPESVMRELYAFINKPYFDHDFDNVEYDNEVFDKAINMKSLHTVRKQVSWVERTSILPKSVWDKYLHTDFWRTPAP